MSRHTTKEGRKAQSIVRHATIDSLTSDIEELEREIEELIQENDRLAKEIIELVELIKASR